MRTTGAIIIIFLVTAAATVVYRAQRTEHPPPHVAPAPQPATNVALTASPARQPKFPGFVSTDAQDPNFVQRVLPVVREFFATLDSAGVNPLKDELQFNKVQILDEPNGMACRFLIGDSWTATTYIGPKFSGIMHFGERGPDNPFRAISHANTNALIRLSERAIKMPEAEAKRVIEYVANTFAIDHSKFEKPEIYSEQMFHYDLGMYSVRYRKKGSDPINQANYPIEFSIRATSSTTAVLVSYSDSGRR